MIGILQRKGIAGIAEQGAIAVRQIALQISADEAEVVVWIGSSQMIIGDLKRNAAAADCQESRLLVPGAMVAIARFMDASLG